MRIAVISGKGGTGKTLIATGLATLIAEQDGVSVYADADVEEPNGHLLLHPTTTDSRPVHRLLPEIDSATCTLCGECSRFCRYSALLQAKDRVMLFADLCHSCGGCSLLCPEKAIRERPHHVGHLVSGWAGKIVFLQGEMLVGEPSGGPILRALAARLPAHGQTVLLDGPPGTSCAVVETLRHADFAVAVTEPTPFGLHDLEMALQVLRTLGLPHGVVINRCDLGTADIAAVCARPGSATPILGRIPFSRDLAEAYARGQNPMVHVPLFRDHLTEIWQAIRQATADHGDVAEAQALADPDAATRPERSRRHV
jgi:MinD superfamily P-loop ATPase